LGGTELLVAVAAETFSLRVRRGADRVALVLLSLTVLLVAAIIGLSFVGFRALVVQSGSMSPTIEAGDVVVVRMVIPSEVAVGDIVTFHDQSRGRLVTHRVTKVKPDVDSISFVTRGDANTGVERWALPRSGSMGKVAFHVSGLGYVVRGVSTPAIAIAVLAAVVLALGAWGLRRIWATP
jgi:signal peptidase I